MEEAESVDHVVSLSIYLCSSVCFSPKGPAPAPLVDGSGSPLGVGELQYGLFFKGLGASICSGVAGRESNVLSTRKIFHYLRKN